VNGGGAPDEFIDLTGAAIDAAERKVEIAAEVMDPSKIEVALPVGGHDLGPIEHSQRLVVPIGDAHSARKCDLRLTALYIVRRRSQRLFAGHDRLRHRGRAVRLHRRRPERTGPNGSRRAPARAR
jgi:hypothetical protein